MRLVFVRIPVLRGAGAVTYEIVASSALEGLDEGVVAII